MRLACDTGGTFTDLIVEDEGTWRMYKAPTDAADPVAGVLAAIELAAADRGLSVQALLSKCSTFVHATTHALNAVLTGRAARTALLVTQGHPDVLTLREGGRPDPFDFTVAYPKPYTPRALTFEIPERIDARGGILQPLDEAATLAICEQLRAQDVGAVAVCLLWSPVNPVHERRIGELLEQHLPGIPYSLSHRLNPVPREYRRASAACIDASLKPLMRCYMGSLARRLESAGFRGRVLVVTSKGGAMDAAEVAQAPIHVLNSGPSMAPVAGRAYAQVQSGARDIIVADTGGTTFDVSVVRDGTIALTRELWIGPPLLGHLTGFPSVEVRSVGAGGGSIARVDEGRVLHVGPLSAGARPGPACYGRGGREPTVTDAAVVLGYLDPAMFLSGAMSLDVEAARGAIARVAEPLHMSLEDAAAAVLELATETMAQAIVDITVARGLDPAAATLVAGGGAAGFNIVSIARRLGCPRVLAPETSAALSAAGALLSDLVTEERGMLYTSTRSFDWRGVNELLDGLQERCAEFMRRGAEPSRPVEYSCFAEGRYADQAWEIEIPLPISRMSSAQDAAALREVFDREHERLYAYSDPGSVVEFVGWRVSAACRLHGGEPNPVAPDAVESNPIEPDPADSSGVETDRSTGRPERAGRRQSARPQRVAHREVYLGGRTLAVPVHWLQAMAPGAVHEGPAIVESCLTTVVIDAGRFLRCERAGLVIEL